MTNEILLDRAVGEWLRRGAPERAASDLLSRALDQAAHTDQERYVTQRLFGDGVGRSVRVRWAFAVAIIALGLIGAVAAVGALVSKPVAPRPVANGWIALSANGRAGATLATPISDPRAGDADIYIVGDGGPRRIIGTQDDGLGQSCPTFSPDGSRLMYRELDIRGVAPTQAPVPEGSTVGTQPSPSGSAAWEIVITAIGRDGGPVGVPFRIAPRADPDSIVSCPVWSPDGLRVAYWTDPAKDVWVVTLDGQFTRLALPPAAFNDSPAIAWSPDGRTIAAAYGTSISLMPLDGARAISFPVGDAEFVGWSPDGDRLVVFRDPSFRVVSTAGRELFSIPIREPRQSEAFWSPDGRSIAFVSGGTLQIASGEGAVIRELPIDADAVIGRHLDGASVAISGWSPDGRRLLVRVGQPLGTTALASVPLDDHESIVLVVPPSLALAASQITWQPVNP